MSKSIFKTIGLIQFLIFLMIALFFLYKGDESSDEFYQSEFKGIINSIEYSPRRIPEIYIGSKGYYLDHYDHSIKDYLQIGDSVSKERNSWNLITFKMKSKRVVSRKTWH